MKLSDGTVGGIPRESAQTSTTGASDAATNETTQPKGAREARESVQSKPGVPVVRCRTADAQVPDVIGRATSTAGSALAELRSIESKQPALPPAGEVLAQETRTCLCVLPGSTISLQGRTARLTALRIRPGHGTRHRGCTPACASACRPDPAPATAPPSADSEPTVRLHYAPIPDSRSRQTLRSSSVRRVARSVARRTLMRQWLLRRSW